jgi:type VI protein secretion system component VasK
MLPFYDRITVDTSLTKPTEQEMLDELEVYKGELTAVENERLRRVDWTLRFDSLNDPRSIMNDLGINRANIALYFKEIVDNADEQPLLDLEAQAPITEASLQADASKEDKKELGRNARRCCEAVLDLIAGWNITRTLPKEDIATLKTTFALINEYLKDNQPWSAKAEIDLVVADALVTQEMLDDVKAEFSRHGLPGL